MKTDVEKHFRKAQKKMLRWFVIMGWFFAIAFALPAVAQDPLQDYQQDQLSPGWSWMGDMLLRWDQVRRLPGNREIDAAKLRGRFGGVWQGDRIEFGVALEGIFSSENNSDVRRNNLNERMRDAGVDQLYLRWQAGEHTSLLVGKARMPLSLSALLWDEDLRPVGVSVTHDAAIGSLSRFQVQSGYFLGNHLFGDDSRIAAAQLGWYFNEGADVSTDLQLSYIYFDDLGQLAGQGLARTNRRVGSSLISDYELLNLQAGLRINSWRMPLLFRSEVVRNLGASDKRDGARFSAQLGDSGQAQQWEFGYAIERIQRDAVMAAFNSDDWWFHSDMRGYSPWLAYGLSDHLSLRLAGFSEKRDGVDRDVRRVLLDLRGSW